MRFRDFTAIIIKVRPIIEILNPVDIYGFKSEAKVDTPMEDTNQATQQSFSHIPVLLTEVLEYLNPNPEKTYIDATLGGGGHTRELLKSLNSNGQHVLGLDQDNIIRTQTTTALQNEFPHFKSWHGNFSTLEAALNETDFGTITGGILADIGVSSFQLDMAERGFSFNKEAPLDMRMNPEQTLTAADIIAERSEAELVKIFSEYGEERLSKTIARDICIERKKTSITSTTQLADLVKQSYWQTLKKQHFRIHPATCVFQALRIAVNDELGNLERFLDTLPNICTSGARIVIISFHSLEDRIVKNCFRELKKDGKVDILTKKPVTATPEEIKQNPRSRSAKLRAVEIK